MNRPLLPDYLLLVGCAVLMVASATNIKPIFYVSIVLLMVSTIITMRRK